MTEAILTNKEFLDALIFILSSNSFYKFVVFLIIILYAVPIGKVILKGIDYIMNIPQRRIDLLNAQNKRVEIHNDKIARDDMFESFKLAIAEVKLHNDLIETILKSLQLSPSNYKYEVLLESFLGLDRSFNNDIKSKILYYIESGKKDKFIYIKKEVLNTFREKVLNKMSLFIFYDTDYMNKLHDQIKEIIENFINRFQDITDIEVAKEMLDNDTTGIMSVLVNIHQLIILEYYETVSSDVMTDYLKRKP